MVRRLPFPAPAGVTHATRAALIAAAAAAALVLFGWNASRAFFLFDDYALVGIVTTTPLADLVGQPFGGFYRPLGLLWARLEAARFGWHHPAGWAWTSLLLHVLVAALGGSLVRRLGVGRPAALAAAAWLLLSPWAGEAVFWISARFDLLATAWTLLFLHAGLCGLERAGRSRWWRWALGLLALAGALSSKEMAVTAPLVMAAAAACRTDARHALRRLAPYLAAGGGVVVAFLVVRARLLPALGGAYGDFGDLLRTAPLARNAWGYLCALAWPPAAAGGGRIVIVLHALALLTLLGVAVARRRGPALAALLALVLSLAPVIWSTVPPGSTANGRYLYGPGLWLVVAAVLGLDALDGGGRRARRLGVALLAGLLLPAVVSLRYQQRLWRIAAELAREAVEQMAPEVDDPGPIHLVNLPYAFQEGPYVLKAYAFRFYYRGAPPIAAEALIVTTDGPALRPVRRQPDPFSDIEASAARRTVVLDLDRFGLTER